MTRKHFIIACLLFLGLALAIAGIGYRAKTDIEAVVIDQFNRQQLLLAQKIAGDTTDHFAFLRTGLESLSLVWREKLADAGNPWSDMAASVPSMRACGSWWPPSPRTRARARNMAPVSR